MPVTICGLNCLYRIQKKSRIRHILSSSLLLLSSSSSAPGSRVAWGVVSMTLPGDDGGWGVNWGWKWLNVAEASVSLSSLALSDTKIYGP